MQHDDKPVRPIRYHTLTEHRDEVTACAVLQVALRPLRTISPPTGWPSDDTKSMPLENFSLPAGVFGQSEQIILRLSLEGNYVYRSGSASNLFNITKETTSGGTERRGSRGGRPPTEGLLRDAAGARRPSAFRRLALSQDNIEFLKLNWHST
ncbi:hypothetical protein EVAR_90085_1 [Eumeta japonica]|uniref:Uncharacterized protein n=1 Tax=Eumeta variegata TaxID=151549 RepID=A0A4C1X235_EUMVA|nr:hypothetical protein EVAR_90085_1 [Eumeta japonica]